jgi:hypothetical protein
LQFATTIRKVEGGFPHSEIPGSKLVRSSPRLIAAYHVLHRLSAPRHPPNALKALDRSHDRCPHATRSLKLPVTTHTVTKRPVIDPFRDPSQLLAEHDRRAPALAAPHGHIPSSRCRCRIERDLAPHRCKLCCSGWLLASCLRERRAARRAKLPNTWWRQTGSNRRPHACKARALPAELCPQTMVGLGRLERPTSPLSGVRSNHLSYRPRKDRPWSALALARRSPDPD